VAIGIYLNVSSGEKQVYGRIRNRNLGIENEVKEGRMISGWLGLVEGRGEKKQKTSPSGGPFPRNLILCAKSPAWFKTA